MASFYWYDRDPDRLRLELSAMKQCYPDFKVAKLPDGRLYYQGKLQPFGKGGTIWEVRLIYPNDYPYMQGYGFGGSIDTILIGPKTLEQISDMLGGEYIPHTYRDGSGKLYICTVAGKNYKNLTGRVQTEGKSVTTGAQTVAWLVKWLSLFEMCLNGELSFDEMGKDGNF